MTKRMGRKRTRILCACCADDDVLDDVLEPTELQPIQIDQTDTDTRAHHAQSSTLPPSASKSTRPTTTSVHTAAPHKPTPSKKQHLRRVANKDEPAFSPAPLELVHQLPTEAFAYAGDDASVFLLRDSPWCLIRPKEPRLQLRWVHRTNFSRSWSQPPPPLTSLQQSMRVHPGLRCYGAAAGEAFCGAPDDPLCSGARTGIAGGPPDGDRLRRTCELLSVEYELYPNTFFSAIGLTNFIFCEQLNYNRQRRRDVPEMQSGRFYIDVGDRPPRRKRHSFHHELFHMLDYELRGADFTNPDAEWEAHNPPGFRYGEGGKHMRGDHDATYLASSPGDTFLNRYCTSAIVEDKAEVWAAMMCYPQILRTAPLQSKAMLLRKRARAACPEMDSDWWQRTVESARLRTNYWEPTYGGNRGPQKWRNFVTGEVVANAPLSEKLMDQA